MAPLSSLSFDSANRVALSTRVELVALLDGRVSTLLPSGGIDWDPDMSPADALVFGSDEGGANELWLKRPGEAPRQLT